MRPAPANDACEVHRDEGLAVLPDLLSLARRAMVTAFEPGDAEADALRSLLEECVVGAHRLRLREKLAAGDGLEGRG